MILYTSRRWLLVHRISKYKDLIAALDYILKETNKVFDITVSSELTSFDTATEVFNDLQKEYILFVMSILKGQLKDQLIECIFGDEKSLILYLESQYKVRYSARYANLTKV